MAGGNFLGRVISYVVNEVVVSGLANSPAFQRFAVRTSKKMQDIAVKAEQVKKEVSKNIESFKNQDK